MNTIQDSTGHAAGDAMLDTVQNVIQEVGDTVTTEILEIPSNYTTVSSADKASETSCLVGWIGIIMALGVGIFAWYYKNRQRKESEALIGKLQTKIEDSDNNLKTVINELKRIQTHVELLDNHLHSKNNQQAVKYKNHKDGIIVTDKTKFERADEVEKAESKKVVKFGTLQMPDENGTLRFSVRSMTDIMSDQKMFRLELDLSTGSGTYHVNEAAINFILSDLQMFQEFVKPFVFTANSSIVSVSEVKPGTIIRNGAYWIVDTPLEVKFI